MLIRITNTTAAIQAPGYLLDYKGKLIPAGRSDVFEVDHIDNTLEGWMQEGLASVQDAKNGTFMDAGASGHDVLPPLPKVQEVVGQDFDNGEDFDFDPADAREAVLPKDLEEATRPIAQGTEQSYRARASVSGAFESGPHTSELSPIPGERVRNLDDAEKYTIRAPRAHDVGKIIGKS